LESERIYLHNRPTIERTISILCRRQRLSAVEAEDFAADVRLRLVADDYAVLRRFEGRSSLSTYLNTVVTHLFQDWRNARWGKWRTSAEAKRFGPVAIELERLIVRDGLTFDQAFETLRARPGMTESRAECEAMATRFPVRFGRHFVSETLLADLAGGMEADGELRRQEAATSGRRAALELDRAVRQLQPQDRLILRMRFQDGMRVVEIGRILQLEAKPLYARIQRTLVDLRSNLENSGFTADTAAEVFALGGLDLTDDEFDDRRETGGGVRPFQRVPRSSNSVGQRRD
jgi:RNA polymerase sigma factor (sigma-70 family)